MPLFFSIRPRRWTVLFASCMALAAAIGAFLDRKPASSHSRVTHRTAAKPTAIAPADELQIITLSPAQQAAIGLSVVPVAVGAATEVIDAPGQVVPDESRFAHITPRSSGLVRSVA